MTSERMKLYFVPRTVSEAVAIAMNEAKMAYEVAILDFANADQTKPNYTKINSKGRVPALETSKGILTETGALLEYIAALRPEAKLLPEDIFMAAKIREMIHYFSSTMHVNHAHKLRGHRWADQQASWEDMTAKVTETMTASCRFIEPQIVGPLLFGESVTLADCHFYAVTRWLEGDGVDLHNFPKISAFIEAMEGRPSVQAVIHGSISLEE